MSFKRVINGLYWPQSLMKFSVNEENRIMA
jgi:hypothetical protein